jgi:hypothetical protein
MLAVGSKPDGPFKRVAQDTLSVTETGNHKPKTFLVNLRPDVRREAGRPTRITG